MLVGYLGRDFESRWTINGTQIVAMHIALTKSHSSRSGNIEKQTG